MYAQRDGWTAGWIHARMEEWMDGRTDVTLAVRVLCAVCVCVVSQ